MSVIILEKWYHEGAPPIWRVKCPMCNREYSILEHQGFLCECENNTINHEEYKPIDKKV